MKIAIDLPNIPDTATEREQLKQVKSYLFQFVQQMQWALETVDQKPEQIVYAGASGPAAPGQKPENEYSAMDQFSAIKAMIIKSADIVNAYYEKIENLLSLSGKYVAQSDFGPGGVAQYIEETKMNIHATSEYINQNFYKKETIDNIDGRVQGLEDQIREQEGYIRYGNVGSWKDENALGIEIGEFDSLNGVTDKRYARFTSYGLELFGENKEKPVAYVYQHKLYITEAEVTGKLKLGTYEVDTAHGLAFKWVGR